MPKYESFYLAYDRSSGAVRYCADSAVGLARALGVTYQYIRECLTGVRTHRKFDIIRDVYLGDSIVWSEGQLHCDQLPPMSVSMNKL